MSDCFITQERCQWYHTVNAVPACAYCWNWLWTSQMGLFWDLELETPDAST